MLGFEIISKGKTYYFCLQENNERLWVLVRGNIIFKEVFPLREGFLLITLTKKYFDL